MRCGVALACALVAAACSSVAPVVERDRIACTLLADDASPPAWVSLATPGTYDVRVEGASRSLAGHDAESGHDTRPPGAFVPALPFEPGLRYQVNRGECRVSFVPPTPAAPPPQVLAVYPRTTTIPENVLRFYIHFSEPMADGAFLDHIRLEEVDTGRDLTGVFFDNAHELWSRDRTRITLLVDPGRVKTGLAAHEAQGRAFHVGATYRLHVLSTWRSLRGAPLVSEFTATYETRAEDRDPVDVDRWTLTPPRPESLDPLVVAFGEPVDHVSVAHMLQVVDGDGVPLAGAWSLLQGDATAHWQPREPWPAALDALELRVHARFEDIAANTPGAAFDHAVGDVQEGDHERFFARSIAALWHSREPRAPNDETGPSSRSDRRLLGKPGVGRVVNQATAGWQTQEVL